MQNKIPQGYKQTKLGVIPEEWEMDRIKNRFKLKKQKYNPVSSESDYRCIELENIIKNVGQINGWFNSKNQKSIKSVFQKGDILFGKLRPNLKKFWISEFAGVCSTEIWVFDKIKTEDDKRFLGYLIQGDRFYQTTTITTGSKMPRANWRLVKNFKLLFPPKPEQQAIARCLGLWDKAIDKQRQLLNAQQTRQKALGQQLLTGKKRLPGFDGEWKKYTLGDFFDERKETNYPDLKLLSIGQEGVYPQSESNKRDISNKNKTKYRRICKGDIGYNTMRMWQGRNALSNLEGVVSPAYTILKPKSKTNSLFFSYLFKHHWVVHKFYQNSQGMVSDTLSCKFKHFKKIKLELPELKEQTAIAEVLETAEREIDLSKQNLAALQTQKKGLMQQLLTGKKRLEY